MTFQFGIWRKHKFIMHFDYYKKSILKKSKKYFKISVCKPKKYQIMGNKINYKTLESETIIKEKTEGKKLNEDKTRREYQKDILLFEEKIPGKLFISDIIY